jgi:hypothetical protein
MLMSNTSLTESGDSTERIGTALRRYGAFVCPSARLCAESETGFLGRFGGVDSCMEFGLSPIDLRAFFRSVHADLHQVPASVTPITAFGAHLFYNWV